jgi:hypothetical protein
MFAAIVDNIPRRFPVHLQGYPFSTEKSKNYPRPARVADFVGFMPYMFYR